MRAAGLDGKLIHGPYGLVIAPLAASRFCSGHLVWMQQDAQPRQCHSVHATFTEFGDAGKRWRFLEANPSPSPSLNPNPDPNPNPSQVALPRGWTVGRAPRVLLHTRPLPHLHAADLAARPCSVQARRGRIRAWRRPAAAVRWGGPAPRAGAQARRRHARRGGAAALEPYPNPNPNRNPYPDPDQVRRRSSRLRANVELMRRQLHALRDALAIARVLNRTLVLPHFDCTSLASTTDTKPHSLTYALTTHYLLGMCDRSELVDYVPSCTFPGAPPDMTFPRKCSSHFVLNVHKLQVHILCIYHAYIHAYTMHVHVPCTSTRCMCMCMCTACL